MAREARHVVPGYPHHVYLRGNNRRILFSDDDDRLQWLRCLQLGIDASSCELHQHTLMDDHIHMIVTPPDEDALAALVKRTCQRYAQLRNEQLEASGKLFEERYQSKVIESERQLICTTLYNDANAFRAGMVPDPLLHQWSTGPLRRLQRLAHLSVHVDAGGLVPGSRPTRNACAIVCRGLMDSYAPVDDRPAIMDDPDEAEEPYRYRIERPDGTSAREPDVRWPDEAQRVLDDLRPMNLSPVWRAADNW